jgi:lytic cellulose monooxygenase (C1-hydroxylating)
MISRKVSLVLVLLYTQILTSIKELWANEELIKQNYTDIFKIPSDIKPGLYVLRTELLALHGNTRSSEPTLYSGPQFYTHCFNVEISGNGNATPDGVTFPGAYKRDDPGVKFNLRATQEAKDNYVSTMNNL